MEVTQSFFELFYTGRECTLSDNRLLCYWIVDWIKVVYIILILGLLVWVIWKEKKQKGSKK